MHSPIYELSDQDKIPVSFCWVGRTRARNIKELYINSVDIKIKGVKKEINIRLPSEDIEEGQARKLPFICRQYHSHTPAERQSETINLRIEQLRNMSLNTGYYESEESKDFQNTQQQILKKRDRGVMLEVPDHFEPGAQYHIVMYFNKLRLIAKLEKVETAEITDYQPSKNSQPEEQSSEEPQKKNLSKSITFSHPPDIAAFVSFLEKSLSPLLAHSIHSDGAIAAGDPGFPKLTATEQASSPKGPTTEDPSVDWYGLPDLVTQHSFLYLSFIDLGSVSQVCLKWERMVSEPDFLKSLNLTIQFPKLSIIDEQVWKDLVDLNNLGLSFDDLEPLDRRGLIPHLKDFSAFQIEEDAGFTLITIPKGLSFQKLREIGGDERFNFIDSRFDDGNFSSKKSYRVLLSNNVLKGDRDGFLESHKATLQQYGCMMPSVNEVTALAILTHMKKRTRLFSPGFTRCTTAIDVSSLYVGGFKSDGLGIGTALILCMLGNKDEYTGVAAMRKFHVELVQ